MNESVYQVITDRILALLQKNIVPWQKPYIGSQACPQNLLTKHHYRGVNVFLLNAMGYPSPYWLSFKQAQALGGHVKRGERSCPVVFWKWIEVENEPGQKDRIPLLRYYPVFNLAQVENIPHDKIPAEINQPVHNPIEQGERIVNGMPNKPEIRFGGNQACYIPSVDRVHIPLPESFRSGQDFYATIFHELCHATGAEHRLNRKSITGSDGQWSSFGSAPYAREELVAECGSAFLCGEAGIVQRTIENSAAYISSWLEVLKKDTKLVVQAAAAAQRAADYVLGRYIGESPETSEPQSHN